MLSKQMGLKLCSDHGCLDNLAIQRRAQVISDILQDSTEFQNQVGEQLTDPGEIIFE
jgi:hypothetical protein